MFVSGVETSWICTLCIYKDRWIGLLILRETKSDSFLEGLKVTNQIAAQRESVSRSELRQRAAVVGISTMKRLVSSANKQMLDPLF